MSARLPRIAGLLVLAATALRCPVALAEAWGEKDKLQDFVSRADVLTNAREIDARGLSHARIKERPWSSTYWPDLLGSVAWRYTVYATNIVSNGINMTLLGWDHNRSNIMRDGFVMDGNGNHQGIKEISEDGLDRLSPAEKYDLLMGDANYTFWNKIVARIDQLESANLLSNWAGICHGWSPASLALDRPLHGVKMMSPLGRQITFYPDDIKALASILWGNAFGNEGNAQLFTKLEGAQCQTGGKSNKNGRLTDPRCQDVNPAFFHLGMVNQIGLNKRGFVMDRHKGARVFNQPTYEYSYRYFRIGDNHPGLTLDQAKVPLLAKRPYDPFRNYRSPKAVNAVGVEAVVWYGKENYNPNHAWTDSPDQDRVEKLTIRYDLELDARDNIVGGEWREYEDTDAPTLVEQVKYEHPNLMWVIPPGLKAMSPGDFDIKTAWDGSGPAPAEWRAAALKSAKKQYPDSVRGKAITRLAPQPLAKVVELLITKARQ